MMNSYKHLCVYVCDVIRAERYSKNKNHIALFCHKEIKLVVAKMLSTGKEGQNA